VTEPLNPQFLTRAVKSLWLAFGIFASAQPRAPHTWDCIYHRAVLDYNLKSLEIEDLQHQIDELKQILKSGKWSLNNGSNQIRRQLAELEKSMGARDAPRPHFVLVFVHAADGAPTGQVTIKLMATHADHNDFAAFTHHRPETGPSAPQSLVYQVIQGGRSSVTRPPFRPPEVAGNLVRAHRWPQAPSL
jgi:hypothetical protein